MASWACGTRSKLSIRLLYKSKTFPSLMTGSDKITDAVKLAFREKTKGVGKMCVPFKSGNIKKDCEYLLVHTNIVIPLKWNLAFLWNTKKVFSQIEKSFPDDCAGHAAAVRPSRGNWETISIWKGESELKKFYLKGDHAKIMMSWRKIIKYGENAITTRYKVSGKEMVNISGQGDTLNLFAKVKEGKFELWKKNGDL